MHPCYQDILFTGCCFGQDPRNPLFDDAPSSTALYGLDIEPTFFDIGNNIFRDRKKFHAIFVAGDILKFDEDYWRSYLSSPLPPCRVKDHSVSSCGLHEVTKSTSASIT